MALSCVVPRDPVGQRRWGSCGKWQRVHCTFFWYFQALYTPTQVLYTHHRRQGWMAGRWQTGRPAASPSHPAIIGRYGENHRWRGMPATLPVYVTCSMKTCVSLKWKNGDTKRITGSAECPHLCLSNLQLKNSSGNFFLHELVQTLDSGEHASWKLKETCVFLT